MSLPFGPWMILSAALLLSGCATTDDLSTRVVVVRDLSKVAGCQFRGTLKAPPGISGLPRSIDNEAYEASVKRRTLAMGANYLYLLNEAAGWGSAEALGTAYNCRY